MALYILRVKEYPRQFKVSKDDMRLEFWAWNVIADRDLTIDARYHRLELYSTKAFKVEWSGGGYMIYTRPMSLTKMLSYPDDIIADKAKGEKIYDISIKPEYFEVEVFADDKPMKVNSVTPIYEYVEVNPMLGYMIQVDAPEETDKPYIMFRLKGWNKEHDERGENVYFHRKSNYFSKPK